MRVRLFYFILLISIIFSTRVFGYAVGAQFATYPPVGVNTPYVHVMVIGDAGELGNQFLVAAVAKAKRLRQLFPDRDIIFIRSDESDNRYQFKRYGINLFNDNGKSLYGDTLVKLLKKYSKIASIDIFSHSNPHYGARLDSKSRNKRFNYKSHGIEQLKDNFTEDAYLNLNGCNMGFIQADRLSYKLGVVVIGAMTSTDFQQLHSDGVWYFNNPGQYPQEGKFQYSSSQLVRMKPINKRYTGGWGTFNSGLPFYKAFCSSPISESECSRIMALSLLPFPSNVTVEEGMSTEGFKQLAADFLCPSHPQKDLNNECFQAIENYESYGDMVYDASFTGNTLFCDHSGCDYQYKCKKIPFVGGYRPKTCRVMAAKNHTPTELLAEYQRYINGFHQLAETLR